LVAFPTETVYGLGAHALNVDALRRLFAAKRRPANDPLIVHVSSIADLQPLVTEVSRVVRLLADRFWPGPLTLVLPRSSGVPDEVTARLDTVAVRVPSHPVARALIQAAGIPVAAPSANLFSRPSPTTAEHVLTDLNGRIDMVLDGGRTNVGVESTVLDLSQGTPTVLRPGAVSLQMLTEILPNVQSRAVMEAGDVSMASPGLARKHYSPQTAVIAFDGTRDRALSELVKHAQRLLQSGRRVGILAFKEDVETARALSVTIIELGRESEPDEVARRLYTALRECDAAGLDVILVRLLTGNDPLADALRDRVTRAAAGNVVVPQVDAEVGASDPDSAP